MSGETLDFLPMPEIEVGPDNPLFGDENMDTLVVGATIFDVTMPESDINHFPNASRDKLPTVGGTTLEAAALHIIGDAQARKLFAENIFGEPERELEVDEVEAILKVAQESNITKKSPGGSATNIAVALERFNQNREEKEDRVRVVAAAGDRSYRDYFEKFFKDIGRGIVSALQHSMVNPRSTIFPRLEYEKTPFETRQPHRQIFTKRPLPPKYSDELVGTANVAAVGKLKKDEGEDTTDTKLDIQDSYIDESREIKQWATELGSNPQIKAMLWVPGDSIEEMGEEVMSKMIKDGSRVMVCNLEEAILAISEDDEVDHSDKSAVAIKLAEQEQFRGIRIVITDGAEGASFAYQSMNSKGLVLIDYKNEDKLPESEDGTNAGMGDVFAAAYFEAILTGFTDEEALEIADTAARRVVIEPEAPLAGWDHMLDLVA
jgi:sugar/nucleoside kinase (ribokinase family)